jgi:hypothetical protein
VRVFFFYATATSFRSTSLALCVRFSSHQFRKKLLLLLRTSSRYDAASLLRHLARCPTLYEERVLLHSSLREHDKALSLLVHELSNHVKAEEYCLEHYPRTSASASATASAAWCWASVCAMRVCASGVIESRRPCLSCEQLETMSRAMR